MNVKIFKIIEEYKLFNIFLSLYKNLENLDNTCFSLEFNPKILATSLSYS